MFGYNLLAKLAAFSVATALLIFMKVSKNATCTVTLNPEPAHELDGDIDLYSDDLSHNYEAETAAELCPVCHDLLAWHEQVCEAATVPQATAQPEFAAAASPPAPVSTFAFAIGHRVQPATSAPAAITWRGQHKDRHPETGLIQRINVYYLDNGYWDCYREEELQAA